MADRDRRVTYVSAAYRRIVGESPAVLVGKPLESLLGHDAAAVRGSGALLRRGAVWAARRELLPEREPAAK